ncbi:MAG TPA: hypothetical protein VMU41_00695 [Candidatus Binataceae bacterium]|nr:hypothetical protein [Candidatus Binataceae bacterium]
MNYLILDGPLYPTHNPYPFYRGTARKRPTFCEALPYDHEINEFFMWYVEQIGPINDLSKAFRYVELARIHLPSQNFEVVEVTKGDATTLNSGIFLGFDLSSGGSGDSLIFLSGLSEPVRTEMPEDPIRILAHVIRRHFGARLNQFGLFQSVEDALDCRKAMIALQSFHADFYEGGNLDVFEITGISVVLSSNEREVNSSFARILGN